MRRVDKLWWWLVPLMLVTMWLGARGLNADTLWGDEYHSISDAGGTPFGPLTPVDIWNRVAERNPWHTPGYFILLNMWGNFVGWSVPMLRALSLLVGLLGVAWTYRLGRDHVSPQVGLYAAAVLGTSATFVYYTHEVRMYIFFVPLTAFEVWLYLLIMTAKRAPNVWAWLGLFVGTVAALYIHYFATLPLMAIGVYHLLLLVRRRNREFLRRWFGVAAVMLAAGAAFLPWLRVLIDIAGHVTESDELRGSLDPLQTTTALAAMFANGIGVLFAGTALLALWKPGRAARRAWFFALATFAFALLVNEALQVLYYDSRVRYLFALWALLAPVIGIGIERLRLFGNKGRAASVVLLVAWLVTGTINSLNWMPMSHYLEGSDLSYPMNVVADELRSRAQPGDVVVNYLPDTMPAWRYGGVSDYYFRSQSLDFRVVERKWNPGEQEEEHVQVMTTLTDDLRVWLAYPTDSRSTRLAEFETVLEVGYALCSHASSERAAVDVALYTRAPVCCVTDDVALPVTIDYGNGIALTGVESLPTQVSGTLPVILAWSLARSVPPNTYSVGLHVTNADGSLVAQHDYGLANQAFRCERELVDVSGLPPGNYQLHLIVYAWQTGARLNGIMVGTGAEGDALPLGRFTVSR